MLVGSSEGLRVFSVGNLEGTSDGKKVGISVGTIVGVAVGAAVGFREGQEVGRLLVGIFEGLRVIKAVDGKRDGGLLEGERVNGAERLLEGARD